MESTYSVMCAICSEFYKSKDLVYSTISCGHIFHYHCVNRWLRSNRTCPQCRKNCQRDRIHPIYLNFGEGITDEVLETEVYNGPIWIPVTGDQSTGKPEGAIKAGTDDEGNDAYVARAYYSDDLLPANFVEQKHGAYAPYGCQAHFISQGVELLVDCKCKWIPDSDGNVPEGAIVTGCTEDGESLYTGRGTYQNLILPGKVHPSHGVLYMPYKGNEVNVTEYEVLVREEEEPK